MTIHNEYFIKVKQPKDNIGLFENIEGLSIKETIQPSKFLTINDKILSSVNNENSRIFVNKDICAAINIESSVPSSTVPLSDKYFYLYKIGGEFKFLKQKPYKNILFQDEILLDLHNKDFSFLKNVGYEDFIQTAIEVLPQSWEDIVYKCFSFNYGGISKSSATFYGVNGQTLNLIDVSNPNIIVDYLEGNLYIPENENNYELVFGLFNVDPIIVNNKGNLELEETQDSFYKFINNSDKGNINVEYINQNTLLTCTKNIYVYSPNENYRVTVDGVPLKPNYLLFIPKNTEVIVSLIQNFEIDIEDSYVNNIEDIYLNSSNYSTVIGNDFLYNGSVVPKTFNNYLYVVQEVEKNTYNFNKPSIVELAYVELPE